MLITPQTISRKVLWRLAVPTIILMLFSALDRVNISFAALQMNGALGLTPSQYGFGAGIFFLGFLAGQYPSVLLLQRIGMRRWMALCSVLWAASGAAVAFVRDPMQFYLLRVVLGLAESGLAPGIVLYLSQFTTDRERATTFAMPMLAIPLSIVFGGTLSGWIMSVRAPWGLASWRWMLIAEALPSLVMGIASWRYFPDGPSAAPWLRDDERQWLARNAANRVESGIRNDWRVLRQPMVWASALLWFCLLAGAYGIIFWLPQIIKQLSGLSAFQIGLVNALPWIGAMIGTYYNARHCDRSGERFLHIAIPALVSAVAMMSAWYVGPGIAGLAVLFVAGLGLGAAQGAFWALPTSVLTPSNFAVAAVAINIAGSSAGLVIPHLIGVVRERSGGYGTSALLIAIALLLSVVLVFYIRRTFFAASPSLHTS